jgi:large subunit ribosomal protein L29
MKLDEIRSLSDEELRAAEENLAADLFRMRFQHQTGQLTNTAQLRAMGRNLAQMKTVRRERELAGTRGEVA